MIRKFLQFILIFLFLSIQSVFADVLRVNDITFDSSDSIIFVSTGGSNENLQIKKGILSNPNRIFLDIENAVLTRKQGNFEFKNGKLSSLRISQFSTAPNTVRIVMTYTEKLNPQNMQIMSLGGNIIIKLQNYKPSQDYLTPIYREVKSSIYDYFEKVQVKETDLQLQQNQNLDTIILTPAEPGKNNVTMPVQKVIQNEPVRINPPIQESKLRSRYFVSDVSVRQDALLVSGTGIINLEKVFYLSNPQRVIFDIPNAVSSQKIRTQTFKISENETAKIGQFEPTKIRVVITSPYAEKYTAIYSNDLQNILIAREDKLQGIKLYPNTSDLLSVKVTTKNEYRTTSNTLTLDFSDPIVHSLKRKDNLLELILYNVTPNNLSNISQSITSNIKNALVEKYNKEGIRILIPITEKTTIDCLENLQATKLVLSIKSPIQVQVTKKNLNKKVVVIDAGHGGSDPGALRNDVLEKTIVLQIAKLVEQKLKNQGAVVYMTRSDDTFVSLSDRVVFSNNREPDVFVSIHINACENETVNGIETHYYKDDSIDFAKQIHKSILSRINDKDRGIFKSRFYVIRNTESPSVLLELGFISNSEERKLMQTKGKQEAFAEAITEGIINYINSIGAKK